MRTQIAVLGRDMRAFKDANRPFRFLAPFVSAGCHLLVAVFAFLNIINKGELNGKTGSSFEMS